MFVVMNPEVQQAEDAFLDLARVDHHLFNQ